MYFESAHKDEREVPRSAPMDTFKCHILPFAGDGDMESYLDWEMKVDQFSCFDCLDYEKVRMVTYEFTRSKSVEDCDSDMEVALIRVNVLESNKATMACFLHELNIYIEDILELYHYASLDDLVHQAIRVEA
ncbi:hypothetical protein CR513_49575, partial [Mucuna pruriens]